MTIASFIEERLELGIDFGAVGGPQFDTNIVVLDSAFEQRNVNWSIGRGAWDLGERVLTKTELQTLLGFFRRVYGRAVGFRFKDWSDWQASGETITPTGAATYQLIKTYAGNNAYVRDIKKPVAGTVTMKRNGSNLAGISVDTTTGIVTLTADATKTITAITKANPGKITATAHGFINGQKIYLSGIGGMTQLNSLIITVTVVDANNFTIGIDTTAYTTFTSGGTAKSYIQPSETLTWSGEFDVPARFDVDKFPVRFDAYDPASGEAHFYLSSLPVVEIRV